MTKPIILQFFFIFLCVLSQVNTSSAQTLELLKLPLSDGSTYIYSLKLKKKCSLESADDIITPELKLEKKDNVVVENINLLQKKLNLEIDKEQFTPNSVLFSIASATNITFEFSIDKTTCKLQKRVHVGKNIYDFNEVEIEYSRALKTPVVKKVTLINNGHTKEINIYPWALRGQISTYELNVGPALNVHSNIRKGNNNLFEKNDPVFEPIPAFFFRYGPIFLNKDGLGTLVYHKGEFNLVAMGILEGEPYKGAGLQERKKGLYLGSIAKLNMLEVFWYKDFFNHKGTNLKFNLAPEFFPLIDWKLTPQLFIQFWDKSYVDYYFSVKPGELSSGLSRFDGQSAVNYGAMMEVMHYVNKWTFVTDFGIKCYGKEVYTSPTVIKRNELRFISSVLYKFF
jgi:hypothetical protein